MEINKEFSKKFILMTGAILLLIIFVPSFYFYKKYQNLKKSVTNPGAIAKSETQKLVEKVGKLILLPKDEDPTLYTVTEIEKIKNQKFFTNAKNGDKVLIYSKARKAILYDPKANKIVEVGPLIIPSITKTITPEVASQSAILKPSVNPTAAVISPPVVSNSKISIYNGSKTAGLASAAKDKINQELPELDVLTTGNAKGDYTENIIVNLKSTDVSVVSKLKTLFSAKVVSTLPDGEVSGGADIVIILGK